MADMEKSQSKVFEELVTDCKKIMRKYYWEAQKLTTEAHWLLGNVFANYEGRLPYGEKLVILLSQRLKLHRSVIYDCWDFRKKIPSLQALRNIISNREKQGLPVTWSALQAELRQTTKRLPTPSDMLDKLEYALKVLEDTHNKLDAMSQDEKAQAEGLFVKAREVLKDHVMHIAQIESAQPKIEPFRSLSYLEFVGTLPCCVCLAKHNVHPHHTQTTGIGQNGSDILTIPLCSFHQILYYKSFVSWQEKYGSIDRFLVYTMQAFIEKVL